MCPEYRVTYDVTLLPPLQPERSDIDIHREPNLPPVLTEDSRQTLEGAMHLEALAAVWTREAGLVVSRMFEPSASTASRFCDGCIWGPSGSRTRATPVTRVVATAVSPVARPVKK
jgi:hypothetical protein